MKKSKSLKLMFPLICLLWLSGYSCVSIAKTADNLLDLYGNPSVFEGYLPIWDGEAALAIDNESWRARAKDERIKFLIIHYTAAGNETSKRALTRAQVSSHYLVSDVADEAVFKLADESKRAWHAGQSAFYGRTNLNDTSLGIEIVNRGMSGRTYLPYAGHQIKKTAWLLLALVKRHQINPKFILGHSDISPGRKMDPGPTFPWEALYREYGLGAWYDEKDKNEFLNAYTEEQFAKVTALQYKRELYRYGYAVDLTDKADERTKSVIYAFQSHFYPDGLSGIMDRETYARLLALNKKYPGRDVPGEKKE